jgi:hypothetical protein
MRATALPPVSRAQPWFKSLSWGLRPRLYAVARFAGFGFTPPESIRQRASGSHLQGSLVSWDWTPNLRSRWQNKAWGASPRIVY